MIQTLVFLLLIKYWYITIPALLIFTDLAGASKRREIQEHIDRALNRVR